MFIYIKHGDNNQLLVNTNCPTVLLLKYIKVRLGLAESELIDLCDERGVLKFLFLPQNSQESACGLLKAKESFIVCIIKLSENSWISSEISNLKMNKGLTGLERHEGTSDGAYTSVTSLLSSVDSALLETLQTQIDNLEKTRLKQLHIVEARTATSEEINAQALSTKTQTKKRKKVTHANPPDEEVQRHTRDRKSRN